MRELTPSTIRKNGDYGVWISSMPPYRRNPSGAKFMFMRFLKVATRIARVCPVFANLFMGLTMPRRHSLIRFVHILWIRRQPRSAWAIRLKCRPPVIDCVFCRLRMATSQWSPLFELLQSLFGNTPERVRSFAKKIGACFGAFRPPNLAVVVKLRCFCSGGKWPKQLRDAKLLNFLFKLMYPNFLLKLI